MSRLRLLASSAAIVPLLALGACGSDTTEAADPATTPSPTTATPTGVPSSEAPTTPAPSATATPTTPAPAPAGRLISYANGDDTGVMIATGSDTRRLTGAPADFRTFIAAELANASSEQGCTEKPQISVDLIDTGGWARGGHFTPQCGGYATLWARSGGTWKDVWGGQSLVDCATLDRFRFPSRVAGDSCLKGDEAVAYSR